MRNASSNAISRRAVMKFARGFYAGHVRSQVNVTPTGRWHTLYVLESNGERRIIGQGLSWEAAYMNMRANLPTVTDAETGVTLTDWNALDAPAVRS